ncbi:MAG: DUF4381 family protein [Candidatus Marinimicrobia bacterium]|nr:DUF4381 family protein [Candidatus Neomarinimicrobiota bacterium]
MKRNTIFPNTVILIILFFTNIHSLTKSINVSISIDTTIATIGDRINLNIVLSYPTNKTPILPKTTNKIGDFEIIDYKFFKPKIEGDCIKQKAKFVITSFDTGKATVPSFNILFVDKNDSTSIDTFKTKECSVNFISTLPPNTQDIKDIKPPFPLPSIIQWDYIIVSLVVILLIIAGIIYYTKWKRSLYYFKVMDKFLTPPHIEAIEKIEEIKKDGSVPSYKRCEQLSSILRRYLERRYFMRALEMTTEEITEALSLQEVDDFSKKLIIKVLEQLDEVKYANKPIDEKNIESIANEAIQFIYDTKKEPLIKTEEV